MTAIEVLCVVEKAGGSLVLNGNRIKYTIPKKSAWLIAEVREQREEIVAVLQQREGLPSMPAGVRLVRWAPKQAPVLLEQCSVVIDVSNFILATLAQLEARMEAKTFSLGTGPCGN